jgi:hypothetical protein
MVMWNLVAHGVKRTVRGLDSFSRTEAGKKSAEVSSKAFSAAKEASREVLRSYKQSRPSPGSTASGSSRLGWTEEVTVVLHDGRVGVFVRYLRANEVGGDSTDTSMTALVLVDLLQHTSEMDRYIFVHESGLRSV